MAGFCLDECSKDIKGVASSFESSDQLVGSADLEAKEAFRSNYSAGYAQGELQAREDVQLHKPGSLQQGVTSDTLESWEDWKSGES